MGGPVRDGAVVRHPEFGLGRVTFAREGFPKVKVAFADTERKVAVKELLVESHSQVSAIRTSTRRNRSSPAKGKTHPAGGVRSASPAVILTSSLLERLASTFAVWRMSLGDAPARPAWRMRLHYDEAEVELVYLVARSPENREGLAALLGRTEHAVDYVWRWCDMAQFPERAGNEIERQVAAVRARLGDEARESWTRVPGEILALAIPSAA